ncbi:MAG: alpha/beta fold hydrolase [Bacteroidia bacterium]
MKLFYRTYGTGHPLLILHGLFGQSDNWNTLAKQFAAQGMQVITADLRNHGQSPHSAEWNYELMAGDILELADDLGIEKTDILGHSMGGRVAMQFSINHPDRVRKLLVADMAPRTYLPRHDRIVEGLLAADPLRLRSRKAVQVCLSAYIPDEGTKQFLLKNLYWRADGQLDWRFNLKVLASHMDIVSSHFPTPSQPCHIPAFFLRGERSDYLLEDDLVFIRRIFPLAALITIPDAGHWIHAEQPALFLEEVVKIIEPVR